VTSIGGRPESESSWVRPMAATTAITARRPIRPGLGLTFRIDGGACSYLPQQPIQHLGDACARNREVTTNSQTDGPWRPRLITLSPIRGAGQRSPDRGNPAATKGGLPSVRGPSAKRPLELDRRIPGAHLGWQVEFITCTVGDTTHSGCHNLLVYLFNLRGRPQPHVRRLLVLRASQP
jgi:hypothetical protein